MIIYNPILGGQLIRLENNRSFDIDQKMDFDEDEAIKMMKEYPFLVDIESEKYSPDNQDDTRSFPIEQLNSGRITARLSEELRAITTGISGTIEEGNSELKNHTALLQAVLGSVVAQQQITNEYLKSIKERQEMRWFKKIFK